MNDNPDMTDATPEFDELGDVTYIRVYDAPVALVFACMVDPEHLTHFWGPEGSHTPLESIRVDLRPGGEFVATIVSDLDASRHTSRSEYVHIVEGELLVWTDTDLDGMTTTASFYDLGDDRTEVVVHQAGVPAAFRTPEAQAGMQSSFDRFADYLATLTDTSGDDSADTAD